MWLRNGVRSCACNDMLITSAKEVDRFSKCLCACLRKTVAVMVQLNLDPRVWEKCLDHRAGQL